MTTTPHAHLVQALHDINPDLAAECGAGELERIYAAVMLDADADLYVQTEAQGIPFIKHRDNADPELGPEPEVDTGRLLDLEQFRTAQIRVIELLPGEDEGVTVPQVLLHLEGVPALHTITGHKTYLTALTADQAMGVGKAMLESGKVAKRAQTKLEEELATNAHAQARPRLVAATQADMAREAAEARAQEALRGRG